MCIPTNRDRRMRAHRALASYREDFPAEQHSNQLVYLLTDLMHFNQRAGVFKFDHLVSIATARYEVERNQ